MSFLNTFSWMKSFVLIYRFKIRWSWFTWAYCTNSIIGSGHGLVSIKRQAITWTFNGQIHCICFTMPQWVKRKIFCSLVLTTRQTPNMMATCLFSRNCVKWVFVSINIMLLHWELEFHDNFFKLITCVLFTSFTHIYAVPGRYFYFNSWLLVAPLKFGNG